MIYKSDFFKKFVIVSQILYLGIFYSVEVYKIICGGLI